MASIGGLANALLIGGSKFHIYLDHKQEWRWYLISNNHRRIADSGEGYKNEEDCRSGIRIVMGTDTSTPIVKD